MATTQIIFDANIGSKNQFQFSDSTTDLVQQILGQTGQNQKLKFSNFDAGLLLESQLDMGSQNIVNCGNITAQNATLSGNLTVQGTTMTIDTQNMLVKDKDVVLNKDGTSGQDIGLLLEKDAVQDAGYMKTDSSGNFFVFKHPQNDYVLSTPVLTSDQQLLVPQNINSQLTAKSVQISQANLNLENASFPNTIFTYDNSGVPNYQTVLSKEQGGFGLNVQTELQTSGNDGKFVKYDHTQSKFVMDNAGVTANSIGETELQDNSVSTAKIQDYSVTNDKLPSNLALPLSKLSLTQSQLDKLADNRYSVVDDPYWGKEHTFHYGLKAINKVKFTDYEMDQIKYTSGFSINASQSQNLIIGDPYEMEQSGETDFPLHVKYQLVLMDTVTKTSGCYSLDAFVKFTSQLVTSFVIIEQKFHKEANFDVTFTPIIESGYFKLQVTNNQTSSLKCKSYKIQAAIQ